MNKKQRGIILLCTLVIMVILSLLLMVGVYRMQSSAMVTKRAIWNIKSYWAARAGNTIVADGCIRNAEWPDVGFLTDFHNYKASNSGSFIEGKDSECDASFSIYYKNKITGSVSSNPPNEDKLINYFTDADVSDNEFYALTVGKSGIDISALELVYELSYNPNPSDTPINQTTMTANQAAVAAACIYVSGSIIANLNGGRFSASSSTSTRPIIVAGGNVSISGGNGSPDPHGRGPLDMKEGTIYATGANLNGTSLTPSYQNNNLINYSVNVFPTFSTTVSNPGYNSGASIPSGTFCFIEVPTKGEYDAAELQSTVTSVLDLYLKPKQFADLYKNDIKKLIESNPTMVDKIKSSNIALHSSGGYGENSFNVLYDSKFKNSLDLFSGTVSGMPSDIADQQRFKIEGEDGKNLSGSDVKEIFQTLHKNYCKHAINACVDDYSKSGSSSATYDSFFIPNGNANINGPLSKAYPHLSFSDFTRARILGNLDEYINGGKSGETNIKDYDMDVFKALGLPIKYDKNGEKDKLQTNFTNYLGSASDDVYIADKVHVSNGDMYCLDTISQHKSNYPSQFDSVSGSIGFDNNKLQIVISSNLKSSGYFNFGAFNRKTEAVPGMPSSVAAILGDYGKANQDHVGVRLLGGSALGANSDIDIEGFVYGTGSLQAQGGDVVFDAVDSSILNTEGSVSLISARDIVIKKSSGGSGNGDVDIKGILWSGGGLNVDVGGDNVNFNVTGSIVCKNGNMNLTNIKSFTITYDPSQSRIIVNTSLPTFKQSTNGSEGSEKWDPDREALINAVKSGSQYLVNTGTFKVFNRI